MGKLNIFEISLENLQGVYFSGQHMNGHVTVELNEPMKMREIRLEFKGAARVHWTERHSTGSGKHRRTTTRHYSANESYFDHVVPLFGRGLGTGEDNTLPQGRHIYPFSFILPPNLPSSFEGAHGYVRYTIKATIDKPWKFDHTTKRPFTVIALLDLNMQPSAPLSAQGQASKMLCCLCCQSGPISGVFRIDRIGYVPGEPIYFHADLQNQSRSECDIRVVLSMYTTFKATSKSRTNHSEVARVVHATLNPGDSDTWTGERLVIPPCPPSLLVNCNIIDIIYKIELIIDPSGPSFDLVVPHEVLIGTIPLRQVVQQYQPQLPPAPVVPSAPQGDYPDIPPPTYNECAFGKTNIRDEDDTEYTRGEMDYAPVYTYYDWSK